MAAITQPLSSPTLSARGRNYLITGGTQGLGFEIATQLKACGAAKVAVIARNAERGTKAVERLQAAAGVQEPFEAFFVEADLSDATGPGKAVALALAAMGAIDGVVNAAATTARGNLASTTAEDWDAMMACNARAPFLITQAATRHMIEGGIRGSIVNISSVAGKGGAPFLMAYSVSKAAASALTRNNAAELAPHGIRVNCVEMGWCATDNEDALQRSVKGDDWLQQADASQPLGRILRPADVAATVCFLLSDASLMMTGNVVDLHPEYSSGMISRLADEAAGGR